MTAPELAHCDIHAKYDPTCSICRGAQNQRDRQELRPPLAVLRMTPKLRKVIEAGLERAYYHPGGSGPSKEDYRWAQQIVAEAHPAEEE